MKKKVRAEHAHGCAGGPSERKSNLADLAIYLMRDWGCAGPGDRDRYSYLLGTSSERDACWTRDAVKKVGQLG
jgi:hypothetical protein